MDIETMNDQEPPVEEGDDESRKDRRVKGTALATYLWEQVPRQLLTDAKAKTKAEGTSIKAVLIRLLRDWTYGNA